MKRAGKRQEPAAPPVATKAEKPKGEPDNALRRRGNVKVVLDHGLETPSCGHGPCLLFERRKASDTGSERFFACAACRSRKRCNFYLRVDDGGKWSKGSKEVDRTQAAAGHSHDELAERLSRMQSDPSSARLCRTCDDALLFDHEAATGHRGHGLVGGITKRMLRRPTTLIAAKTDAEMECQYWFDAKTGDKLIEIMAEQVKCDGVICVGCPRLFESLAERKMPAFLLDIDNRLAQFHTGKKFARYNMFTDHLFAADGREHLEAFCRRHGKVAIVADPPFGALLSPLCHTLLKLRDRLHKPDQDCPLFILSPYFMESKLCRSLPTVQMTDYKANYENHAAFNAKKGKKGSAVRLFTDADMGQIALDEFDGYRHCAKCSRWVYAANKHCNKCNSCTGKDGGPYSHCNKCKRCFKETYRHCPKCNMCHLPKRCIPKKAAKVQAAVDSGQNVTKKEECEVKDEPKAKKRRVAKRST